jgi:quercetin dioxygenase-like cupin family protein
VAPARIGATRRAGGGRYSVAPGAHVHTHAHPNEEVWHVVEGALELTLGAETQIVHAGGAAIVPADQPHSARALEPTRAIVVDYHSEPHSPRLGCADADTPPEGDTCHTVERRAFTLG